MAPPKVSSLEQPTPSMETEKTREHSLQNLNENSVTRTVRILSGQIMDEELDKGKLNAAERDPRNIEHSGYIKQGTTYTEVETYLPRVIPKNNVGHVSSSLSPRPTNDTNSNPNGCHITPNDIPTFYYGTISKTPPQTASWKRMVRTTLSLESTLKISLGSKRPTPSDQDHLETPVKRRLVSQDSSSNNIVLAEAESQPCQHP